MYNTGRKQNPIEDPEEAKEHIAQYFENLYQAYEGRPQFEEWTNEIKKHNQNNIRI